MSGKTKSRNLEVKAKPPEESPVQTSKDKQRALGRPSGFVSSRQHKKVKPKRNNLALLLSLNKNQPKIVTWRKAWKISKPLPQPGQMSPPSDWGHSWKFLNLQPNNEGKLWLQGDTNNNTNNNHYLYLWNKAYKAVHAHQFEQEMPMSDWKQSWKYAKQRKDSNGVGNGLKHAINSKLDKLLKYHRHSEEQSLLDWNDSWMSVKPLKQEYSEFTCESVNKSQNIEEDMHEPDTPWGESWKHFKKQLHSKSKSTLMSLHSGWGDSWRLSKPNSQMQQEKIANLFDSQTNVPLDPRIHQPIVDVPREVKYKMLWRCQFHVENMLPPVWQQSWIMIKVLSECTEQPMQNLREEESELQMESNQEAKLAGFEGLQAKHVLLEVFPKMHKPAKDMETFVSTRQDSKNSWKSLKNQLRQDRTRNRHQNLLLTTETATAQSSLNEWANSWRSTTLNVTQNIDLWHQNWSVFIQTRSIRQDRKNETLTDRTTHNGHLGPCGWNESWRFTKPQIQVEKDSRQKTHLFTELLETQVQTAERSRKDWEQSWQFSTNQFHHDRPSLTKWEDSWFQAKPSPFSACHMVFWSRNKFNRYLLSNLSKDCARLHKWNKAWRFAKLDLKTDETVIMVKEKTEKRYLCSELDQTAPQIKRWADACKIAKSQLHPKRNDRPKVSQEKGEDHAVKFAEWTESWKFMSDSLNDVEVKTPVSLSEWEESWKSLLTPHPPKKSKGRF